MENSNLEDDSEIAAITAITAALSKVSDPEARSRVLTYVVSRYLPEGGQRLSPPANLTWGNAAMRGQGNAAPASAVASSPLHVVEQTQRELPGVARLTDSGDLKITARDLKAKNGLDAAIRLAHIAIYAHERFTGQPLSSRKGLTPLLKEWRLYDGNTRARLAKERGILRSDDSLALDAHARRDAERYVDEILSEDVVGQWKPR